ncbi:MAG: hypothetical protein HRF51_06670 [bacterium]|jgi:hypothetical protein
MLIASILVFAMVFIIAIIGWTLDTKYKKKLPYFIYASEAIIGVAYTIYLMHFMITRVMKASTDFSLFLLIPTSIIMLPILIDGLKMMYEINYRKSPDPPVEKVNTGPKFLKSMTFWVLCIIVAIPSLAYSFIYIYFEENFLIGIILGLIGVTATLLAMIPFREHMKKSYIIKFFSSDRS